MITILVVILIGSYRSGVFSILRYWACSFRSGEIISFAFAYELYHFYGLSFTISSSIYTVLMRIIVKAMVVLWRYYIGCLVTSVISG